jgi:hypothetical protein
MLTTFSISSISFPQMCVWMRLMGDHLNGPHKLPHQLTGVLYYDCLWEQLQV